MYTYESLQAETEKTMVITRSEFISRFQSLNIGEVFEDRPAFSGKGPLAGLYTAMQEIPASWYMILPCDMPGITPAFVRYLKDQVLREQQNQCLIPSVKGYKQPAAAVYHRSCLPHIELLLKQEQLKMTALFERVNTCLVYPEQAGFPSKMFCNINTKADLSEMAHLYDSDKKV